MVQQQKPVTMKDTAYEAIKTRIVNGEWEGGTFLTEKYLSELLQMSKTPIRSALDRLEMMGLVKLSPKQGIIVQYMSLKKVLEVYELRLALETFAAVRLTGKLSASILQRIDENLDKQEAAIRSNDINGYTYLDREFHELLVSGLDNAEFDDAMSRMQDKFMMALKAGFIKNRERLWGSHKEHRRIAEAYKGDDPAVTEKLVAEHIELVKAVML
ncbi:GntR family transcriptional regulator [Paenibacillus contaminans]|uniref:HTH gntR-type domain-containing protein n=1 Tax=Paenibacillus contaminans TaxID=450362 RepID=A0A329MM23_9BACL|nr:GntR family transcriptional regulator [Paenibacillus contaminans]RAV20929.1 hypothetical protein DQG23_12620 [Paenibacillus contaminans]